MRKMNWQLLLMAALALVGLAIVACGDDDDDAGDDGGDEAAAIAEVEGTAEQLLSSGPEDVDFFIDHTTDNMRSVFGYETEDDCRADPEGCVGEPTELDSLEGTEVDGDTAVTTANTADGAFVLHFVQEEGVWKADALEFGAVAIPEGVTAINVSATEYAFDIEDDIEDGNVAFVMNVDGEEDHEMIVMKTADDFDLDALLAAPPSEDSEGLPPGIEEFVGIAIAGPGDSANLVAEGELASGTYLMICFFDTPDGGSTHAAEGMHQEFEVP